jgi:hypothetical protein
VASVAKDPTRSPSERNDFLTPQAVGKSSIIGGNPIQFMSTVDVVNSARNEYSQEDGGGLHKGLKLKYGSKSRNLNRNTPSRSI